MKAPRIDTSGTEAAQRAIAAAQQSAANLQANFAKDLTTDGMSQVVAGATADASAELGTQAKRRRVGSGLASQLGVSA